MAHYSIRAEDKPVAKGGQFGARPPTVEKLAPCENSANLFCADLIVHMEPLKLKKSELN